MSVLNPLAQKIFAKIETTAGTLIWPVAADSIIGAGYAESSRSVGYTDSPEIRNSLNLKDQVKDKDSAGEWSIPMLVRPAGYTGTTFSPPMGKALYQSLMGLEDEGVTGSLDDAAMTISTTGNISVDNLTQRPKAPCVILIGSELIYIDHIDTIIVDPNNTGKYQANFYFESTDRGYAGTTVAAHPQDQTVTVKSYSYSQSTDKPTFSLWYEKDGIVFFCAGCTVSEMTFTASNKGYPMFEFKGGFMSTGRVGQGSANGGHTSTVSLQLQTGEGKYFSVGGRIYNYTSGDNNSNAGYEITDVNATTDTLTLGTAITASDNDVFKPYLPDDIAIGSTLESEDTVVSIGDYSADGSGDPTLTAIKPTAFSLTVSTPVKYIEEEITPDAISEYTEERRAISGSYEELMQVSKLSKFYDADNDVKKSILLRIGADTDGYKCMIYMRRCTVQVPVVSTSEPLINITADYTALDDDLSDSLVIAFV